MIADRLDHRMVVQRHRGRGIKQGRLVVVHRHIAGLAEVVQPNGVLRRVIRNGQLTRPAVEEGEPGVGAHMIPCLHHIARLQAFHRRGAEQTRTGQLRNAPIFERRVVVVHELEMVDGDRLRRLLIGISVGPGLLAGRLTASGRRDRQDRLVSAVIFHGHGRKRCHGKGKGENAGHHRHAEAAFQRSTRSRSKSKQRFHVKSHFNQGRLVTGIRGLINV